jgi:hypothetical protein
MKELSSATETINDKGALIIMCGRNEDPWPNATACWKIDMVCTRYMAMDTCCQ